MYRQLLKLAFICNICFWCTVGFQFWKKARLIPEPLLNTIVILGICAVGVNIVTLAVLLFAPGKKIEANGRGVVVLWALGISAVLQVVYLFIAL
jgi:hypothetical protein